VAKCRKETVEKIRAGSLKSFHMYRPEALAAKRKGKVANVGCFLALRPHAMVPLD
jgi:hypothetical protein